LKLFSIILILSFVSCSNLSQKKTYSGHGGESVSKEDLRKYAPKPIPKELTTEIESQLELRSTSLGQLTPDGKKLFFKWSVTGTQQVWKIDGPKSFPVQMTGGANATYLQDITEDGKWLIHSRDEDGDEYPALFLQSVNGGSLELLYGKSKVKVRYLDQTKDGKNIYFRANDIEPTVWGIYKYNLASKTKTLIYKGKGYWYISDRKETGDMILSHSTGNVTNEHFLYNEKTKKISPLLGQDERESFSVRFAPGPGKFFVVTNKFSDFKRLYLYDKKDFKAITPEQPMDVVGLSISKNSKRILIEYNNNGRYTLEGLNAKTFQAIKMPKLGDALHTYFGSSTTDSRYTIFGKSYHNKPRSSYVYNWNTRKLVEWTIPSSPELDTSDYSPWVEEFYKAEDGTMIPMIVKRPKECIKKTCPVIVSFHGGPEGQSKPSFSPYTELFVKRGFVYVKPNVRGSRGYGKKWINADNGAKRLDVITDIRDCSIHIKKNWSYGGVVPKIGIVGGSYGGYSTLYAMTVFAGHYDTGVARVGMSNLVTFLENTADHRRYLREAEYGYLATDRKILEKLSPINYIERVEDPLLIIQGVNDPRVPVGEALQFKKALDSKGIKSSLILFADEGHGVRKRKNRTLQTGHTLNFFLKHLL
jgi:dipeptidyl aminopeptidase/acylaminoacyl peptidase